MIPVHHGIRAPAVTLCCAFLLFILSADAQTNIPLGEWRLHLSYHDVRHVEVTDENVFAATKNGIIIYNKPDASLTVLNTLNGLSGTGITSLGFDDVSGVLLIGYEDGNLDLVSADAVSNFTRLKDTDLPGAKRITHIATRDGTAYMATSYGVVVFNVSQGQVKETWRDLGPGGQSLAVYWSTFSNDSIFLATADGVIAGSLQDNLLDYNNWKRFNTGEFAGEIRNVTSFNGKIYAALPGGVRTYAGGSWSSDVFSSTPVQFISGSDTHLFVIADGTIYSLDVSGDISEISDPLLNAPVEIEEQTDGVLWIADAESGLLSNISGQLSTFIPNGPATDSVFRIVSESDRIYALPGGFTGAGVPLGIEGHVSLFQNGSWSTERLPVKDVTDIAFAQNKTYVSAFGGGILATDGAGQTILNESNSPLNSASDDAPRVASLHATSDGLWVALYGGQQPIHLLREDDTWQSFSFGLPNEQAPVDMAVDGRGILWVLLDPASGGGLIAYDIERDEAFYQSTAVGQGALPHENVNALDIDRDGYAWIGTDAGVAYFFSATEDALKPVFGNRLLLRDEKVTALEIDGGNRKWIGTEQGVWLFDDTGESLIHHFTTENSPLLSDIIRDIEINPITGEVFIATANGIASYQSDATLAADKFDRDIRIFPNPVHPGYTGAVGITGLSSDAVVKITDIRGRLVWQSNANGGTASWNVRDYRGNRASTGVYLVFAISADGRESIVGKIALIE